LIDKVDFESTVDFIAPKDKTNPTVWKLSPIPSTIASRFALAAGTQQWDATMKAIQAGLKGWTNFSIPYKTEEQEIYGINMQVVPINIINFIPPLILLALAGEIYRISRLSDDAAKN